ncbi:MAG: dihydroneopterin aldolase [Chloroflexi bacterium]|nr:dihydroneopterin aldolase [Chloroflexota bacterium]
MSNAKDKIIIKDLLLRGIIGINDWERDNPQDILINIVLYADLKAAGQKDDIEASVNYRTISKKVIKHVETAERLTVEALAEDIARLCLEEKHAEAVKVRVEKPGAVRFANSVGVEIERHKI